MWYSRTLILAGTLAMFMVGCDKPADPQGQLPPRRGVPLETLNDLWTLLEGYRESPNMPMLSEIAMRFGEPSEIVEESYRTDSLMPPEENEYFRYSAADKSLPRMSGKTYRYRYEGEDMPWLDVRTRSSDGEIVGWEWAWVDRPAGNGIGPPGSQERRSRIADTKSLWDYLESFRDSPAMPSMTEVKRRFGEPNERTADGELQYEHTMEPFYQATPTKYYRFPERPWAEGAKMPVMQWFYRHKGNVSRLVVIRTRLHDGSTIGWEWAELDSSVKHTVGPD